MTHFHDRCRKAWAARSSLLCVGLDPARGRLPAALAGRPTDQAVHEFCLGILQAAAPYAVAIKPQIAYFAADGLEDVLQDLRREARAHFPNLLWILDSKRGDIGSTAECYAREAFERFDADAVTLSPYMGYDSLEPFLDYDDKGIFLLCRTSNPGGDDLQMIRTEQGDRLFERVAQLAATRWRGQDQTGLVVGATYPEELAAVRGLAPDLPLLVPGIGAQGGDLAAVLAAGATADGGLLINASRSILYASSGDDWQAAAASASQALYLDITRLRHPT